MHGIHSRRGRGGCAEQCSPHRSPTRAVSFQISVSAREVSRGHPGGDASCRLGEATALSSCARRANTQHVGAQSLVHDIHGGCARVSMVSFGRDPAPELVGVLRVGSLCVFFARVCGSSVALSRLKRRVRLISPLAIWRGEPRASGNPQRLRIQCTAHAPFPWSLPRQGLHTTGHLRPAAARRPPESSVRPIPSVSGGSTTWRPC